MFRLSPPPPHLQYQPSHPSPAISSPPQIVFKTSEDIRRFFQAQNTANTFVGKRLNISVVSKADIFQNVRTHTNMNQVQCVAEDSSREVQLKATASQEFSVSGIELFLVHI
ncbi:unnamed protein product [Boreogadus saida]